MLFVCYIIITCLFPFCSIQNMFISSKKNGSHSLAMSIKSKICLLWIKAFWVLDMSSPITFFSLFERTLARILYMLAIRLIGLKSFTFIALIVFGNKGNESSIQALFKHSSLMEVNEEL